MDAPILKGEPICYNSRDYLDREGMLEDADPDLVYESRGPNECSCDVCFYGTRAAWLAGRQSVIDNLVDSCEHGEPCGTVDPEEPRCGPCSLAERLGP